MSKKEKETKTEYLCNECDKHFSKKSKLNRHLREQHKEEDEIKRYDCDDCPQTFKRKEHLNRHRKAKHLFEKFQCQFCVARFVEKYKLRKHLKVHHSVIMCNDCDENWELKDDNNKTHICNKEKKNEELNCDLCPKKYKRSSFLDKHKFESHGISYSKFKEDKETKNIVVQTYEKSQKSNNSLTKNNKVKKSSSNTNNELCDSSIVYCQNNCNDLCCNSTSNNREIFSELENSSIGNKNFTFDSKDNIESLINHLLPKIENNQKSSTEPGFSVPCCTSHNNIDHKKHCKEEECPCPNLKASTEKTIEKTEHIHDHDCNKQELLINDPITNFQLEQGNTKDSCGCVHLKDISKVSYASLKESSVYSHDKQFNNYFALDNNENISVKTDEKGYQESSGLIEKFNFLFNNNNDGNYNQSMSNVSGKKPGLDSILNMPMSIGSNVYGS